MTGVDLGARACARQHRALRGLRRGRAWCGTSCAAGSWILRAAGDAALAACEPQQARAAAGWRARGSSRSRTGGLAARGEARLGGGRARQRATGNIHIYYFGSGAGARGDWHLSWEGGPIFISELGGRHKIETRHLQAAGQGGSSGAEAARAATQDGSNTLGGVSKDLNVIIETGGPCGGT